jgi:hypothetical protein
LDVDPKTFKKWLNEAGIDPKRQRHPSLLWHLFSAESQAAFASGRTEPL